MDVIIQVAYKVPAKFSGLFTCELKHPDQVADSGIYHSTGFSASSCMWIIQALLDRHEIDRSEFLYSARSNKNTDKE